MPNQSKMKKNDVKFKLHSNWLLRLLFHASNQSMVLYDKSVQDFNHNKKDFNERKNRCY